VSSKVNRQWRFRARPVGLIKESDFEWREEPVAEPAPGQVLVRNVYLSLDPANRGWLNEEDSYVPAVALGDVMRGYAMQPASNNKPPTRARLTNAPFGT
jgi:NADPH-dependent curcumin reductase CurA